MSAPTPGPWEAVGRIIEPEWRKIDIAEVLSSDADARLIAAAPELLDALQAVLGTVSGRRAWQERWPKVYEAARAAIAKAEGRDGAA